MRRLAESIRQPDTGAACRWSTRDKDGTEIIDINHLLILSAAWMEVDVKTSARLISDAVRLLSENGELWAVYRPDGTPASTRCAAWPRLLQTVEMIWNQGKRTEFLHSLMPHLTRYLQWALAYFDPIGTGCPAWHSREEAFTPEYFDPHIRTPDLSVFLLAEISAFERLKLGCIDKELAGHVFDLEKSLLQEILQTEFWDRERHVVTFIDTRVDSRVKAPQLFTLLAMVAADKLPEIMLRIRPQIRHWVRPGNFDPCRGPEHTESHPHFAVFMLTSLQQSSDIISMARLKTALRAARLARGDDPVPYTEEPGVPGAPSRERSRFALDSVVASALAILSSPQPDEQHFPVTGSERVLQILNRHPRWTLGLPVGLSATAVVALILIMLRIQEPTGSQWETQLGLAKHYAQTGRYAEAIRLYNLLIEDSPDLLEPRLMKANTLSMKGHYDEAVALYNELMDEEDASPLIALDLVLALKKAGNDAEALRVFIAFREQHEANFPLETRHARRTLAEMDDPSSPLGAPVQSP